MTIDIDDVLEPAVLNSVTVGSITRTAAEATFSLSNVEGTNVTVYSRYRTPAGSGSWLNGGSGSTSGTSVTLDMAGLTEGATYRVQGSLSSSFTNTVQADFSALTNNGPVFASTSVTLEVEENRLAGTNVGDPVIATDADGDTLTYTMAGTNASSFDIDDVTAQITVGTGTDLDFETKSSYSVTVTATDQHAGTATASVTIEVVDVREVGILGRLVITVGHGSPFGYVSGSYGTLDSGEFPGDLFGDGNARTAAEVYEDEDGYWYFYYSGGVANDWLDDQDVLDEILVEVMYEDERDARTFVLGGFITGRPGSRGLKMDPPLPSRDWEARDGEEVAFEFRRHVGQAQSLTPPALTGPTAQPGSFIDFLKETTPGGPVMVQSIIVIMVYAAFIFKTKATPRGMMGAAVVLVLTPWVPAFFDFGDTIGASIVFINVVLGAYAYRAFAASPVMMVP